MEATQLLEQLQILKQKEIDRKAKLKIRVQRWITNHPEEYERRKKVYCEKKSEVRRQKKLVKTEE